MAKSKTKLFLGIFFLFLILGRLFGGVYEDDEFNENFFFIKSSPTWKWYFYSPRGMSDIVVENMAENHKYEQLMFEKYVSSRIISFPIK